MPLPPNRRDRRASPRIRAGRNALAYPGEIVLRIIDTSAEGGRFSCADPAQIPDVVFIYDIGKRAVHEAAVVWRSGKDFGARLVRTAKVTERMPTDFLPARAAWSLGALRR